jgi:D-erythronate 2-dehydrogenase
MRVVVTGAAGFVGRALVAALARDHEVIALDRNCKELEGPGIQAVEGDFGHPKVLARAFSRGCDAVAHLATIPGGAAEQDPREAFRVNVTATAELVEAARSSGGIRFVFASSIAVLGDPLPPLVEDATPLRPRMVYGAHKAMVEQWLATMSRRGALEALSLRLPGIVARPLAPSGMKSAFISNLFHAARAKEPFVCPVSAGATMWLMSRARAVDNFVHGLMMPFGEVGDPYAVTLPAVRVSMAELAGEVARQAGADPSFVRYERDPMLEAGFGRQPPLVTPAAGQLGFANDGSLEALVGAALAGIAQMEVVR